MNTVVSLFGVHPKRVGGTEALVRETSIQLAKHGWEHVAIFAGPPSDAARAYLTLPNLELEIVDSPWETSVSSIRAVGAVLKKYRPRVFHYSYTGVIGPYPWLARWNGVERVFFTDQGSYPEDFRPRRAPMWKRFSARLVDWPLDRVFCISESNREALLAVGTLPADRISRLYNAVYLPQGDLQLCGQAFKRRFSIAEDRKVVLQVSWIIPDKGIPDLLEAARRVLARRQNVQFVFVGEGDSQPDFVQSAKEMGITEHVTWTGLVQNPLEEGAYAAADIVCQVSRWREAFGWSISEAMACSRPLVATNVGGIPELVHEGATGLLVDKRDPAAIADRLLRLLDDAELRSRMGAAGRSRAAELFDLPTNVAELLRAYGIGS